MATVRLTRTGYDMLRAEFRDMIEVRRPQVLVDLAQAREYGDISENAEYETAKRDLGVIEGRIHELEGMLSSVDVIELPDVIEETMQGARVRVRNLDANKELDYVLVDEHEAHLVEGYISVDSPLGASLMGRRAGETVVFSAPAGTRKFVILEVSSPNGTGK